MIAIKIENLSKQYRLGAVSTRTLSHDLNRWWMMNIRGKNDPYLKIGELAKFSERKGKLHGEEEYIWALRDINLEIQQGEVLGIIGKNGSGKSTLLKILSKVTVPTTGTVKARGRIASLLEVGTGFHSEMTGRENIFMNSAIMGMTKTEIQGKLDEIIDFAGVEQFIDTPVKRYSTGMLVRLGFAVAAYLEPEILVVDEVLAVGDAEFQKKAIGKMQQVSRNEGRTVLFVSHNMASIQQLCTTGILIHNGITRYRGQIEEVINTYLRIYKTIQKESVLDRKDRLGNGKLRFCNCDLNNGENEIINTIISGSKFFLNVKIKRLSLDFTPKNLIVTANITDYTGKRLFHLSTFYLLKNIAIHNDCTHIQFIVDRFPLCAGKYFIGLFISDEFQVIDWIENVVEFEVKSGDYFNTGKITDTGVFFVEHSIEQLD